MNTTPTLGGLVAARPSLGPFFENLGFDYCCGGHRTLEEAARDRGLDPETVATMLTAWPETRAAPTFNPALLDNSSLIDHLVTVHHSFVRRELPRLTALAAKVVAAHGQSHPELFETEELVRRLASELLSHLTQEEEVLFPRIRVVEGLSQSLKVALQPFFTEHEEAGGLLTRLRTLTSDFSVPADACSSYRSLLEGLRAFEVDLHQHIHLENNVLFVRLG